MKMRLDDRQRAQLRAMGFTHAVVIAKDVSVCIPGSVESVFSRENDAVAECNRLNRMYWAVEADSHQVVEL